MDWQRKILAGSAEVGARVGLGARRNPSSGGRISVDMVTTLYSTLYYMSETTPLLRPVGSLTTNGLCHRDIDTAPRQREQESR